MKKKFIGLFLMMPLMTLLAIFFFVFWSHPEQGGHEILIFFCFFSCSHLCSWRVYVAFRKRSHTNHKKD